VWFQKKSGKERPTADVYVAGLPRIEFCVKLKLRSGSQNDFASVVAADAPCCWLASPLSSGRSA